MHTHDDVFFQVPQSVVSTSEGAVALPIMYYDASALYAFFLTGADRVAGVLGSPRLTPAVTFGGRSLVAVACYEYRDTSVGAYNEVGVAACVSVDGERLAFGGWPDLIATLTRPEQRRVGMHVLDLPVTTGAANAAGREIWGFPKFVTQIAYHHSGRRFDCTVAAPGGGTLMALGGRTGLPVPVLPTSLALYSELDGQLLRSTVNARGRSWLASGRGLRLRAPGGGHPMSRHLEVLGLDGCAPLAVTWTHHFQSRLNAGVAAPGGRVAAAAGEPAPQLP